MKVIVLMGSPNRNGSTGILVDNFKRGAEEAGHSVDVIDVCHANIHPCIGFVMLLSFLSGMIVNLVLLS